MLVREDRTVVPKLTRAEGQRVDGWDGESQPDRAEKRENGKRKSVRMHLEVERRREMSYFLLFRCLSASCVLVVGDDSDRRWESVL